MLVNKQDNLGCQGLAEGARGRTSSWTLGQATRSRATVPLCTPVFVASFQDRKTMLVPSGENRGACALCSSAAPWGEILISS